MEKKFVVTINRHCGSGGGSVGRKVATRLGVAYYDKELLDLSSDSGEYSLSLLKSADDRVKSSLVSRLSKGEYDGVLITEDDPDFKPYSELFDLHAKAIRELAHEESMVIVGRCSDFVLKGAENRVSVFITADERQCVRNEMERLSITNLEAKSRIARINAYRAAYYRHHTGQVWDDPENYDLVLSTSEHSYDECANLIIEFLKKKEVIE